MLDIQTLKNIHDTIESYDHETVELMRSEAMKELGRLKIAEINSGLNAYDKKCMHVNIAIITKAEATLYGE